MGREKLQGKTAIVTGASQGIGKAVALTLARQGANVALAARNEEALQTVAQEIEALGRQALVLPTDVTQQEQNEQLVADTLARWGRLDIVVANAGLYVRGPIQELTIAKFQQSMAVNFYSVLHLIFASLPHLRAQNSGHIVYISTMDARTRVPLDAPYVAAKSAASGFMDVLRQELHGSGVYTTTVYPGRVDTPMIDTLDVHWLSAKIPPQAVANATLRAINRRQPEVIGPPLQVHIQDVTNFFFPRLADWIVRVLRAQGWEKDT